MNTPFAADTPPLPSADTPRRPWWKELNRYHWFVFIVAALGWLFDTMDQQLFTLARMPAMREVVAAMPGEDAATRSARIAEYGGYATSIFLLGWACGGLFFGILGDRLGRVKTMLLTILVYSIFTGLSSLAQNFWQFALLRFLTGLGVGGEFAVGVALVAEVMPPTARPYALGLLQALSAVGNIAAALISMTGFSWRAMFLIGTVPALLSLLVRRRLKEPETWQAAAMTEDLRRQLGSYKELFGDPRWRKHALLGLCLASSGVIGLWGIGFFSPDLNRLVFRRPYEAEYRQQGEAEKDREFVRLFLERVQKEYGEGTAPDVWAKAIERIEPGHLLNRQAGADDAQILYSTALARLRDKKPVSPIHVMTALETSTPGNQAKAQHIQDSGYLEGPPPTADAAAHVERITARTKELNGNLTFWASVAMLVLNAGAFFGIYSFSLVSQRWGRKNTFALCFLLALLTTALVFWYLGRLGGFSDIFWMIPLMGFCQLALFGGYAIYFPELFPTHLRSTGISFCYNVGRIVAALGPSALGLLQSRVFTGLEYEPMRYAGVTMCGVFLLGLLVLPFAPETKDQPLPT
jgi:MFS family permease